MKREVITIGIGYKVETEEVKQVVKELQMQGYLVYAPFYILYHLGEQGIKAAKNYLKDSIERSEERYRVGNKRN